MERIKTYTNFKTDSKPEIDELNKAGQVHENELKTEEEIENEETADEFLQDAEQDGSATEIQMDENIASHRKSVLHHIIEYGKYELD